VPAPNIFAAMRRYVLAVKRVAQGGGVDISALVREAVDAYLASLKRP